jgi:hypothetical protein
VCSQAAPIWVRCGGRTQLLSAARTQSGWRGGKGWPLPPRGCSLAAMMGAGDHVALCNLPVMRRSVFEGPAAYCRCVAGETRQVQIKGALEGQGQAAHSFRDTKPLRKALARDRSARRPKLVVPQVQTIYIWTRFQRSRCLTCDLELSMTTEDDGMTLGMVTF